MQRIAIQQGDLILVEGKLPKGAKLVKSDYSFTALKGEGVNTHDIVGTFNVYEAEGILYFVPQEAELRHDEHGVTTLPKKTMFKRIEREFDYEEMEARNTQD